MKTKKKEIEFKAEDLMTGMYQALAHAQGKLTCRTVVMPKPVKQIKPQEIRAIRQKLRLSQTVFAALLNVPPVTERKWESGARKPSGAALKLLSIAKSKPEVLIAA